MTTLDPVWLALDDLDPYHLERPSLVEATTLLPSGPRERILVPGYGNENLPDTPTVILARPLRRLDGWELTAEGITRLDEEARSS